MCVCSVGGGAKDNTMVYTILVPFLFLMLIELLIIMITIDLL